MSTVPKQSSPFLPDFAQRVVFVHVPKSAGTSVIEALSQSVQTERICPHDFAPQFERVAPNSLWQYQLFRGHFTTYTSNLIPQPKFELTFLRDPKKRIISQFYYWKSHSLEKIEKYGLNHLKRYKEMTLKECIMSRNAFDLSVMQNYMVRFFMDTPLLVSRDVDLYTSKDELLRYCVERVKRFQFVGFVEDMEYSYAQLRNLVPLELPEIAPMKRSLSSTELEDGHESVEREPLDSEMEERLDELTELDRSLYNQIAAFAFEKGWISKLLQV